MPVPQLTASIRINLAGIAGGLQRTLQGLINRAAFGLQAAQDFDPAELRLPDVALHLQLSGKDELWDKTHLRTDFRSWVLAAIFRDAVEAFGRALEEARSVCATWALSSPSERVSIADWNERFVDEARRFHRRGLPDKFDFLRQEYAVALPEDKEKDLLSLNRTRNCLVHRGGVVSLRDLDVSEAVAGNAISEWRAAHPTEAWTNEQIKEALQAKGVQPALTVSWLKLQLISELDGGTTNLDPREEPFVPGGSTISIQVQRETRAFDLGSRIELSSNDFAEICFAFFNAAQTLTKALEERGRSLGVQFTEQSENQDQ